MGRGGWGAGIPQLCSELKQAADAADACLLPMIDGAERVRFLAAKSGFNNKRLRKWRL